MNDELVDEAKQAKKERRVAIKLYEKSKDVASACLEKLLTEKEAKKHLKDELASLLKIQQSQQILLDNYKTMIEGFKSLKLSLKQEVKVGWRGGARWPLWVTEVCCELIVNGSPPSEIPSSIGTLTATFYGEEPKKLPSINYVHQCQVLVQVIGETITAMKCPNWAQIFFDSTAQRQVPFTAIVVSLMDDGPDSIDPIIVSSCFVLEDETSEKQVDGIVNKVSCHYRWCICIVYFDMANMLYRLINSLKNRLIRLSKIVQRDCPDLIEMLPSPDDIDITKLGVHAGLITTDSCNAAQKARRLLQHKIG
jgi:hypothetical protein